MTLMFHSTLTLLTLILLMSTIFTPLTNQKFMTNTLKYCTMLSLIPTCIFINLGMESTTMTTTLMLKNFNLTVSFTFDKYSMIFLPIALCITWSIMEFSTWYMATDPDITKFSKYLMLFLTSMLMLTTANNMFQLFVGWEGVGITSFLLISWWKARDNANTAAMQAIIYNRIGDIGLILFLVWTAMNFNSWDMQFFKVLSTSNLPLLGLVLAALAKSAQFGLHPWLPSAMEGPTPVSALLHSSTMVVAGVFLLIRLYPMMQTNNTILTICLCLGGLTTLYGALSATTQNDIKKIIAFSTLSQLGLMMLAIGMKQPNMAFMHITTHAFFKAMLFLCAGSIIHTLNNEQDIRKMGGLQKTMPITTSCLTLGNLALAGTPFLAGFYTKDMIIETMNSSTLNTWSLLITMLATMLTASYSIRLTIYTQLLHPRYPPLNAPKETNTNQIYPIIRLACGSVVMGLFISTTLLPHPTQILTLSPANKFSAIFVTLLGLIVTLDLMHQMTKSTTSTKLINSLKSIKTMTITPLSQLAFFNTLMHRTMTKMHLKFAANIILQLKDLAWFEMLGPVWLMTNILWFTHKTSLTHLGNIKTYLLMFTLFMGTTCLYMLYPKL